MTRWKLIWKTMLAATVASTISLTGQQEPPESQATAPPQSVEWAYWGADERSSRYSPLEQVNAENFGDLEIAWRWKAANYGPEPDYIYRATPIYVNGKIYTVAGQRRTVVCIDPTTGETLWMFRERQNPR